MYFEALASGGDDWYNVVLITAPEGASITFDDGDEEITVLGTGSQYPVPLHNDSSTYSITVNANGFVKTNSVTTSATSGEIFTKIIKYAKITLTYDDVFRGQNFNITDGSISPSTQQAFPSTGNTIDLYVPNTGTWKTSSSAAGESYESKGVTVVDLDSSYVDELHTRPDGKTVTPTDDIQIWLECAGIRNKSYTTLAEVLADKETLQTLISDENAVDYMVRSKSWITGKGLVPVMTNNTTPSGECFATNGDPNASYAPYKAFDGDDSTFISWVDNTPLTECSVGYDFGSAKSVYGVYIKKNQDVTSVKIKGSNDKSTWNDIALVSTFDAFVQIPYTSYRYYALYIETAERTSGWCAIFTLQFYSSTEEVAITDDPTAMRYIGLRNYAADTLLDDEDWLNGIVNSEYIESVLNVKVPILLSDSNKILKTGERSGNEAYKAFDGNPGSCWYYASGKNNYIGYQFDSDKKIKVAKVRYGGVSASSAARWQLYIQASPDNVSYSNLVGPIDTGSILATVYEKFINLPDNENSYYRLFVEATNTGTCFVYELQFYGREDVDESVIHIYSAASDNDIHYMNGSTPVTVASTDTDGHGTIARNLLSAGTYDLYSSVAMDPDGDLSTEYFHKEVTVKADTIEIMLMPDNALYWYGYVDSNLEDISTDNGWTWASVAFVPGTRNTRNISFSTTSNQVSGISTKNTVNTSTTMHAIYKGTTPGASSFSNDYGLLLSFTAKNGTNIETMERITTNNLVHATAASSANEYVAFDAQVGMGGTLHAFWYE